MLAPDGIVTVPVNAGEAFGARRDSAVSARVVSVPTAPVVNAVVATCVVLVRAVAVGAVGTPVRAGDASGA